MSEPAILNWDRVIHKNVRTSDNVAAGSIIAEAGDKVTIMQGTSREYNVPKEHFTGFNGAEVYLDIPFAQLETYRV
jgi:hypothetical protein